MSEIPSASAVPSNSSYDLEFPHDVHVLFGVMSIGGSLAYVLFGVSCSQIVWYFRSYPRDPLSFKTFVGIVCAVDVLNFGWTIANLYYVLILRGIGMDSHAFVYCNHWTYNAVLVLTELCCCLVELFFILRMWRFAEKKRLAVLAFVPYFISGAFNIIYLQGMLQVPCYPDMLVNRNWLILSYGLKILSDGVIAGTMTWLLYHRSRGVRKRGGTIRVIRALIYWTVSTGLVLWISTLFHLLTYVVWADTYLSVGTYFTRGRIYVVAMLAVINDRRRCQEAIQQPESISLRITGKQRQGTQDTSASNFWKSVIDGETESDVMDTQERE